jgi:hypothetical protein
MSYVLFGKNIMIKPIEEDRSEFEKLIQADNEFRAKYTRWGIVEQLGQEVDLGVAIGDTVKFLAGTADWNDKENMFIVAQDKIILKKEIH